MRELLQDISNIAISNNEEIDTSIAVDNNWLGFDSVSNDEIEQLELRLSIQLPEDYISFLKITNGFRKFCSIDSGFEPIDNVDYLTNLNRGLASHWLELEYDFPEIVSRLKTCIVIGGIDHDEQQFLLIPPGKLNKSWLYWKFSNWGLGEIEYNGIRGYLEDSLKLMQSQ
jgi:hypothetical protein